MSHMSATCAHGVTFQSFTVPTMYDYCAVQMLSGWMWVKEEIPVSTIPGGYLQGEVSREEKQKLLCNSIGGTAGEKKNESYLRWRM